MADAYYQSLVYQKSNFEIYASGMVAFTLRDSAFFLKVNGAQYFVGMPIKNLRNYKNWGPPNNAIYTAFLSTDKENAILFYISNKHIDSISVWNNY